MGLQGSVMLTYRSSQNYDCLAVFSLLRIYFPQITVTVTVLKFGWISLITITVTVLASAVRRLLEGHILSLPNMQLPFWQLEVY